MNNSQATLPKPVVDCIKIPDSGSPYLEGFECKHCHAIYLQSRDTCGNCGTYGQISVKKLQHTGKLYSYSIVHRSFPGVKTPFISAIVDLDGGGTLKGNLIGVDTDPEKISLNMSVEVVFDDALGRQDKEGHHYLSYFFQPVNI